MALATDIHRLIETEDFFHYSQGLFDTDNWTRMGDEILLRSNAGNPEAIFNEAKRINQLYELETKSILKVFKTHLTQNSMSNERLFINIYPSTLLNGDFPSFIVQVLNHFPIFKHTIVIEIIETERVENIYLLKERILFLKSVGFLIAIDDVGKGWSTLSAIIELEPHFLKLDQYFSLNLSQTPLKQEMIQFLLQYAKKSNSEIVLEGIEYESDLLTAKQLGVPFCQGFLLDKPKPMTLQELTGRFKI